MTGENDNHSHSPIILFTYPESVIGRRMDWYLTLRGIPYVHCTVDNKMPRPVLARLNVQYRRIPVLAIGRDIYCDSRVQMDTLEKLWTDSPRLGADPQNEKERFQRGVEKLMETFAFDGGLFWRTASLIPPDTTLVHDPKWLDDREEMTGRRFTAEGQKAGLTDGLASTRMHLQLVEECLLGDGRAFIAGEKPGLGDVHLGWAFDWMLRPKERIGMRHAYPDLLNERKYPRVFAWIERINKAVEEARERSGPLKVLNDKDVVKTIEESGYYEPAHLAFDNEDPTGLKEGQETDIYPTDMASGFVHRDRGKLIGLTVNSVTVQTKTMDGVEVRIHYPRQNIKVAKATTR